VNGGARADSRRFTRVFNGPLVPAEAGTQLFAMQTKASFRCPWIPAFAGMNGIKLITY
jgi:hypothetical protein